MVIATVRRVGPAPAWTKHVRLEWVGRGRGNTAGIFLAVIIQGGNNAPNLAIIPQYDRLPTMI